MSGAMVYDKTMALLDRSSSSRRDAEGGSVAAVMALVREKDATRSDLEKRFGKTLVAQLFSHGFLKDDGSSPDPVVSPGKRAFILR